MIKKDENAIKNKEICGKLQPIGYKTWQGDAMKKKAVSMLGVKVKEKPDG